MICFVETKLFTRLLQEYLPDDEYLKLQQALLSDPEAGAVIPGSGGVRKLRWGVGRPRQAWWHPSHLFSSHSAGQIWMLTLYAKNVTESISATVLKQINDEIDG